MHDQLTVQINIDELPLFKSTSESVWPILGLLQEEENPEPFVIGLWVGMSKPKDSNAFLAKFVDEMKELQNHGIPYNEKTYVVKIANFVCDAPARAFVKKTKGHGGYGGCDFCQQRGKYINHRMTFPELDASPRSDIAFHEMQYTDSHQLDRSRLTELNIGPVSNFPHDYMHLVCLGVVKKIILLLMNGLLNIRVGNTVISAISETIMTLKEYLPREFLRKGRSLTEIERWKATEFRTFMLYTGPIALLGELNDVLYKNFLMLFVGITVLCSKEFCATHCDYAGEILYAFVKHFGQIYGEQNLIYNVHGLTHLAAQCKLHGPLHKCSGFPFENFCKA